MDIHITILFTARMPFLVSNKDEFGMQPQADATQALEFKEPPVHEEVVETSKEAVVSPNSEQTITIF